MELIDKNGLVAKIKSRINNIEVTQKAGMIKKCEANKKICLFKSVLSLIDTLEVKEVDLDKEIEEHALGMPMSEFTNDGEVEDYLDWAREEFRHFFELGLKAKKGE